MPTARISRELEAQIIAMPGTAAFLTAQGLLPWRSMLRHRASR